MEKNFAPCTFSPLPPPTEAPGVLWGSYLPPDHAYLQSLGFARHPFPVAPDESHFFMSGHIRRVVAELVHAISARKGFMTLTGDVGLGKTTISRHILTILAQKQIDTALLFHTSLKHAALLQEINRDFGLTVDAAGTAEAGLGDALHRLYDFLLARYRRGGNCAIIIDDAQNLDRESLELVRMISNLETDGRKLVQILLVGQPELRDRLNAPDLRQLKSRIFIDAAVHPLARDEVQTYIGFKLGLTGNSGSIRLTRDAHDRIYTHSRGNPRRINMLMDRCLYAVCRDASDVIDSTTVRLAQADMQSPVKRRFRRIPVAVAVLLLPLCLGVGGWMLHLNAGHGARAQVMPQESRPSIDPAVMTGGLVDAAASDNSLPPVSGQNPDIAVRDFLKAHQLAEQADEFIKARQKGSLTQWAAQVHRETGQQLVRLPVLPAWVRERFGTLYLMSEGGRTPVWLLFWRPALTVDHFYYGYAAEEIMHLQTLLAVAGTYRSARDGVVGPRLMKAVVDFQTRNGLPVTGQPDAATLFLLHQLDKENSDGRAS
ncbi:MAG: AAA family ATPase [Desulfatitalea sp.]|nr:AAA family ATPase [Desulfatitalea sp.]NNK02819.1 AAA family ATPase [Desulfatitalea sp.]